MFTGIGGGGWWYGDGSSKYFLREPLFRGDGQQQDKQLQQPLQHWIPQHKQLMIQARIAIMITAPTMIATITGHLITRLAAIHAYK